MKYRIKADDETQWEGRAIPTDAEVNALGMRLTREGWNGTVLDLYCGGEFVRELHPDFEVPKEVV